MADMLRSEALRADMMDTLTDRANAVSKADETTWMQCFHQEVKIFMVRKGLWRMGKGQLKMSVQLVSYSKQVPWMSKRFIEEGAIGAILEKQNCETLIKLSFYDSSEGH